MSYWKLLTARWGSGATETDEVRIDASTNSLQVVEYEHHEIHSGSHFVIQSYVDLAINNVYDLQFVVADSTAWPHFTFDLGCESETLWHIYEDVVLTTTGSVITILNNNRNVTKTSSSIAYSISNTSVANADLDTVTSGSTILASGIIGAGKNGGSIARYREFVLKQNTTYGFRAVANAAGYVNFNVQWYEHTDKH